MLAIIYPGMRVPEWLETITLKRPQTRSNPHIAHAGLGLVSQRSNRYHVLMLAGSFIKIHNANNVDIVGCKNGVWITADVWRWFKWTLLGRYD